MRIKSLLAAALAKVPNFIRPFNINQRFGLLCVCVSVDKVFFVPRFIGPVFLFRYDPMLPSLSISFACSPNCHFFFNLISLLLLIFFFWGGLFFKMGEMGHRRLKRLQHLVGL